MVFENAIFMVRESQRDDFIATAQEHGALFRTWPGCSSVRLLHCVEVPERFILEISWESVESHMAFRKTAAFETWAKVTADYREVPVDMTHYEVVASH